MHQPIARKVLFLGLRALSVAGTAALVAAAEYYELPDIERIDRDLYRSAEVVIETRSCTHRPAGEEALRKYEGPGEYEIIWKDHSTCEVERVAALESDYGGRPTLVAGQDQGTQTPGYKCSYPEGNRGSRHHKGIDSPGAMGECPAGRAGVWWFGGYEPGLGVTRQGTWYVP